MDRRVALVLGTLLTVAGFLFALLEVGVLLIADCSAECVARGERLVVWGLIVAGLVGAGAGIWLVRKGLAGRRAV